MLIRNKTIQNVFPFSYLLDQPNLKMPVRSILWTSKGKFYWYMAYFPSKLLAITGLQEDWNNSLMYLQEHKLYCHIAINMSNESYCYVIIVIKHKLLNGLEFSHNVYWYHHLGQHLPSSNLSISILVYSIQYMYIISIIENIYLFVV